MNSDSSTTETSGPDSASPDTEAGVPAPLQPLRIYPVVLLLLSIGLFRLIPTFIEDAPLPLLMASVFGPVACAALIVIWWLTFSRASRNERVIGFLGLLSAFGLAFLGLDPSMVSMPGVIMVLVPLGFGTFGLAAVLFGRIRSINRTFLIVLLTGTAFGSTTLLRADGMWGNFKLGLVWRWSPSAEDRLADRDTTVSDGMAQFSEEQLESWFANPDWPSFRGADGSGQQQGSVISESWSETPPQELWKIAVGPGWSSFAVAGKLLMTQEQRGLNEAVVCYHADNGSELWLQEIESRFSDPLGGPGPRATPALSGGRLFVQGANGQVLCLEARTGDVLWQRDLRELADREPPEWGFSSSPLVVDSQVIVYAGGKDDKGVFALDVESGSVKWSAPSGDHSYSSPQLCRLQGEDFVTMLTNAGVDLLNPASGEMRLNYEWSYNQYRALQPHVIDGSSLMLPSGVGAGTRRIDVTSTDGRLQATEAWTAPRLKPDFNDFVVHNGFAYGFGGSLICCIDLKSGQQKWKRGRYGKGQILLLRESELLLVMGEYGDIVLLKADPSGHQELAKVKALDGKTWNHPVVIGDRLYIRNSQEASCWTLPTQNSATQTAQR